MDALSAGRLVVFAFACAAASALHSRPLVWNELSVGEFEQAVKDTCGTVLVPIGCLEKHGYHLPLGTDQIVADLVARKAAEIEPAIVFPFGPYGAVAEARHRKGAVSISNNTLRSLLGELCDEFARNGCTNVVLINEHGGNGPFLDEFVRSRLEKPRSYNLYRWEDKYSSAQYKQWHKRFGKPPVYGHAGIYETSLMISLTPHLVYLEKVIPEEAVPKGRMDHFRKCRLSTPVDWFAQCDTQIYGDPRGASKELGDWLVATSVTNLVEAIRLIKRDGGLPAKLREEFDSLCKNPAL